MAQYSYRKKLHSNHSSENTTIQTCPEQAENGKSKTDLCWQVAA